MSLVFNRALCSRGCSAVAVLLALAARAGDVVPPEVTSRVEATLPEGAPAPLQDHVLLEFTVGSDGVPSDVLVIESAGPLWDRAATEALVKWRFKPATHDGAAVPSRTRLEFKMPVELMARPDAGAAPPEPLDAGPPVPAIQAPSVRSACPRTRWW